MLRCSLFQGANHLQNIFPNVSFSAFTLVVKLSPHAGHDCSGCLMFWASTLYDQNVFGNPPPLQGGSAAPGP